MLKLTGKNTLALSISAALAAVAAPTGVLAQGAQVLDEVVVTARKREESLQDMGMSVSALSGTEVEATFARDIGELANISPNLIIDDTSQGPGGVAAVTIRGIGIAEVESSFDPAVGVVIDGLFLGKASGSITKLLDIERIEVLRGPQGTLFGRNSIGGVINITRAQPSNEFGGKFRASYGNYQRLELDGLVNIPLGDEFAVKLLASRHDQGRGYFYNLTTDRRDGEEEYLMFGAQMLWTPRDDLEFRYSYMREEYDQDTPPLLNNAIPGQLFCDAFGFCAPRVGEPSTGDRYTVEQNGPNDAQFDADTHILGMTWDINDAFALDYIFGFRKTDEEVLQDFDATPLTLFETSRPEVYRQRSHELRLTSVGERLNYTVGAYLFNSEYTIDLLSFIGFVIPDTVIEVPQTSNQTTESWALFVEADYALTDTLTLTVGGRYSDDKKTAQITNDVVIVMEQPARASWSEFTPKLGLQWAATDEVMLYALYSTGYRAGGFSGRPTTQEAAELPYDPETVKNYEIGLKSELFQRSLRLNASVFRMDYDDKQEEQSVAVEFGTGQQTVVANAASATIWGAELDFLYLPPLDGLTIQGNVGWLNASYDEFVADIGFGGVTDNSGLEFRRAPRWNSSLAAVYEWETGPGTAWVRAGWRYLGSHEVSLLNSPQTSNSAQHLVDASINYRYGNAQFSLYGRNLLNEDGYTVGFDVGGLAAGSLWTYTATRPPRTWGVQITYDF